jgi:hypothetical protein
VLVVLVVLVGLGTGAGGAALWSSANDRPRVRDVAATGSSDAGGSTSASTADGLGRTDDPDDSNDPTMGAQSGASVTVPTTAPPTDPRTSDDVAAGLLSLDVPASASGRLGVVPGDVPAPRPGAVKTVRVEVEEGLDVDGARFAGYVMETLNDPHGWGAGGAFSFARTDDDADYRVVLASATTVDRLCAPLRTQGEVSCAINGHATINYARWVTATPEFGGIVPTYRQYVVNHEVGHLLGHGHVTCPGAGRLAPVMQQQTYGVAPCLPNAWPNP